MSCNSDEIRFGGTDRGSPGIRFQLSAEAADFPRWIRANAGIRVAVERDSPDVVDVYFPASGADERLIREACARIQAAYRRWRELGCPAA